MRISIFDYDNTLKLTNARPPAGWSAPEAPANMTRNSVWETQPESVNRPDGIEAAWNQSVLEAVRDRSADPFTVTVLMTARDRYSEELVRKDLDGIGVCFDAYIFEENVPKLDDDLRLAYDDMGEPILVDESPDRYKRAMTLSLACWMNTGEILFPGFESHTMGVPLSGVDEIEIFDDNVDNIRSVAEVAALLDVGFTGHLIELAGPAEINEGWRGAGDPPLPGNYNVGAPKRKRPPKDRTYGAEPDLLDRPGVIVEPDVRKKISDYFTKMKLREMIRRINQGRS